jgi:hypothetical protein
LRSAIFAPSRTVTNTNKLTLHNVGVEKAVELSDGTIAIFSSEFHNGATGAVTRIYRNGRHKRFLDQPPYRSPWYSTVVATGISSEVAATRELVDGPAIQLVLVGYRLSRNVANRQPCRSPGALLKNPNDQVTHEL